MSLYNCVFGVAVSWGTYLGRTDCKNYQPGDIVKSLILMNTATFSFGESLPFLKDLASAKSAAKAIFDIIDKPSDISM
jgi:hypothetical protein